VAGKGNFVSSKSTPLLIGIDAGTSVIKAVAFTGEGEQLAVAGVPNSYVSLPDGGVEQDMARTWGDIARVMEQLANIIPGLKSRVAAVSVTGQGDGLWLIDKNGEPVAPAWLWLDARAASIVEEFTGSRDYDAHYSRTGTGVNVCQMSVQLAWMTRHRPEVLAKASHAFHCKDWIYFKLTGQRATDPSEGNFTFGNYKTRNYAADILDHLGASPAKALLTPIVDGTRECARITDAAAQATGLPSGTPVCLGYVDVLCTGLGGGLYDATGKSGCTIVGSTGMHMRLQADVDLVRLNPEKSGYTMAFPAPGMVAQIQSNMASTLNIDWLLDLARGIQSERGIAAERHDLLAGIDGKIMQREEAKLIFHPYISKAGERGPFMEPSARAMFMGLDASVDYHDMMRAVIEGLGFAARDCYLAMGEIPKEIRLTGGAAKSNALRQIFASILKTPVRRVAREEAGAAGAAMIAAVQQGIYADMDACAARWVEPHFETVTKPEASLMKSYDKAFEAYVEIRKAMRPIWRMRTGANA
jgi:erythritol kinase (D-erythritol 1-phosphate-forming)